MAINIKKSKRRNNKGYTLHHVRVLKKYINKAIGILKGEDCKIGIVDSITIAKGEDNNER